MSPRGASILPLLLALAGCASAITPADPVAEVRCAEVAFSRAAEARDMVAFLSHLDPDARFVGESVHRGPDAVAEAWAGFFRADGPRIAWRPEIVEVLDSGDYALSRGPYRLELSGPHGEPDLRWGTFNSIWRRGADGRWRVVFDAGSPGTSEPAAATRALFHTEPADCPPAGD